MKHLRDQSAIEKARLQNRLIDEWPGSAFFEPNAVRAVQQKVDKIAHHMQTQLDEHEAAMKNTQAIFEQLLQDLDNFAICFQEAFNSDQAKTGNELGIIERVERLPQHPLDARIRCQIDPDRSVGILNILWHAISFTMRGNTKPLALSRPGRPPLFTGRIIAFNGDFLDHHTQLQNAHISDQLHREVASLYIPADQSAPAVMQIKHLHNEETYFHQADAARRFLLRVVEIICGGGFFHEQ